MVLKFAAAEAAGFLLPQQVSLALAAGTEVLIHGFRDALKAHGLDPGKVLLRVDAKNSFNSILRAAFLRLVILHTPSAAQLVHALYGAQPFLTVGGQLLRSAEGTQQGDPLGGLLFCLVIQPLVMRIHVARRLDFNGWYADDGNIYGDIAEVAEAYRILVDEGPAYNFLLVKDKTSLWSPSMDVARLKKTFDCDMDVDVQGRPDDGVVVLGSPVGSDAFVAEHVAEKAAKVDVVLNLVRPLDDAQIALPLHRACLSVVLFNHIFRTTPPAQTLAPALLLDAQQTRWLDNLLPALPPLSSAAVAQCRLPLRHQGLGLTAPSDVVRPAFLASKLDTASNVARLRPSATADGTIANCATLVEAHIADTIPPLDNDQPWSAAAIMGRSYRKTQNLLITHIHDRRASNFWPSLHAPLQALTDVEGERICRRKSLATPGGSDYLLALAINHPMPSDDFQVAIARRLRLPLVDDSLPCPACDLAVDRFGDHHLVCTKSAHGGAVSRNARHNSVRDNLHNPVVKDAQLPARIEPEGLIPDTHGRTNHDRPADVFVDTALACTTPGADKTSLAIDVTVVTADAAPLASAGRSAATRAEDKKRREWAERVADVNAALKDEGRSAWIPSFEFRGFGMDVFGALGDEAQAILQMFAERRASRQTLSVGLCKRIAIQGISITVHSANARMIRSRTPIRTPLQLQPPSDSLGAC